MSGSTDSRVFSLGRMGRTRHHLNCCGANADVQLTQATSQKYRNWIFGGIGRIQRMIQELKKDGLPGGEAHRLDQYLSKASIAFDTLTNLKEYRTPQGFRAFARSYILLISVFYGPYYVYLGKTTDTEHNSHSNLEVAIVFGILVQAVLNGLFTVMLGLEDPFGRPGKVSVDSIKITSMFEECRCELLLLANDSEEVWNYKFNQMDLNHDGVVERHEIQTAGGVLGEWGEKAMDDDRQLARLRSTFS
eukprot:TRINITY_DN11788_c0_g1_i1.p1 TRINITY_DN11788_c0_g1~~TRINITY_DN11788_c0_g1_i1.p1  ORF type:complete len:247 (-),score=34.32 TRINITY_DN11788_c0_g1_i1:435-1175(-)